MNLITQNELSMTSLEISELVKSRHDKVKQSIERLAKRGVITAPPVGISENINNLGFISKSEFYIFKGEQGKRDSIIVIAQLCPEYTAKIVDRWQELESKAFAIPKTLPEALRLAAKAIEENIQLNEKIALDAPKVDFVDKFVDVGTTKSIREAIKILGLKEQKTTQQMIDDKILFEQSGVKLPHANHIQNGNFKVFTGTKNGHAYTQTRVTTKGLAYLAKRYTSQEMVA